MRYSGSFLRKVWAKSMLSSELCAAFRNYVGLTVAEFSAKQATSESAAALLEKVGRLEETDAFRNLIDATQRAFSADDIWIVNLWRYELGNFFRRTGFYESVHAGRQVLNTEDLLEKYQACLERNDQECAT